MFPLGIELLTHDDHMLQQLNYIGPHDSAPCKGEQCVCRGQPSIQELGIS